MYVEEVKLLSLIQSYRYSVDIPVNDIILKTELFMIMSISANQNIVLIKTNTKKKKHISYLA